MKRHQVSVVMLALVAVALGACKTRMRATGDASARFDVGDGSADGLVSRNDDTIAPATPVPYDGAVDGDMPDGSNVQDSFNVPDGLNVTDRLDLGAVDVDNPGMPPDFLLTGPADVGTVAVGSSSAPVVYTLKNTGGESGTIMTVATSDPQFVVSNDSCTGQTIDAAAACTFTITFKPSGTLGTIPALIQVTQAAGSPMVKNVIGHAFKPATLLITPNPIALDGISLGTTSDDKPLTVTNNGGVSSGALTFPAILGNGFSISGNTCGSALAPTESCTFSVNYTPQGISQTTFNLTVISASGATGMALLTGTGRLVGPVEITPHDVLACSNPNHSERCFADTAIGQTNGSWPTVPAGADAPVTFTITYAPGSAWGGLSLESGIVTVKLTGDFIMKATSCGPSLVPTQTCLYLVSFKPTTAGRRTGTIVVTSANGGKDIANLEGMGLPAVEMQPCGYSAGAGLPPLPIAANAPAATKQNCIAALANGAINASDRTGLDFGQVLVNADCNPKHVKWYLVTINSSTETDNKNLLTTVLTDPATAANFRFANATAADHCSNVDFDVSAGPKQCWISVQFAPQAMATVAHTATLAAKGDAGGSASASLRGTASGPLTVSPNPLDFGLVFASDTGSQTLTLTVNNSGSTLPLGPIAISPTTDPDFRLVLDTCTGTTLGGNPGGSCDSSAGPACYVAYRYFPSAVGEKNVTFTASAGSVTTTATMHAAAVSDSLPPETLAFGDIMLSKKSDWQAFTVTAGFAVTGNLQFGLTGLDAGEFEIAGTGTSSTSDTGTCGLTNTHRLGGSNPRSCTIKVRFIPRVKTGLGPQTATLTIVDAQERTLTRKVALTGRGTPQLSIQPTAADFGAVAASEEVTKVITFVVTNHGSVPVNKPIVTIEKSFQVVSTGASDCPSGSGAIAANGGTCNVAVTLKTPHTLPGPINANSAVVVEGAGATDSNDPDRNQSIAKAALSATIDTDPKLQLVGLPVPSNPDAAGFFPTIDLGASQFTPFWPLDSTAALLFRNMGGHSTGPLNFRFYRGIKPGTRFNPGDPTTGTPLADNTDDVDFKVVFPTPSPSDPDSRNHCMSLGASGLEGGHFCKVLVKFNPTHPGILSVGLAVWSSLGGAAQTVAFTGRGSNATDPLTITPAYHSFFSDYGSNRGPVTAGLTFQSTEERSVPAAEFTITNPSATVTLANFDARLVNGDGDIAHLDEYQNAPSSNFVRIAKPVGAVGAECPKHDDPTRVLGPKQTCSIWVKFLPRSATPVFQVGVLQVTADSTATPVAWYNAGLMGKVREGTKLDVWAPPSGTLFGSVPRGSSSSPITYTVMNVGDSPTGNASDRGFVSLLIAGSAGPDILGRFAASGCGPGKGALTPFDVNKPALLDSCEGSVVLTPGSANIGDIATNGSTNAPYPPLDQAVLLEADYAGTNRNNEADTFRGNASRSKASMDGICINPPTLVTNPTTNPYTFPVDATLHGQPLGTMSATAFFSLANGSGETSITLSMGGKTNTAVPDVSATGALSFSALTNFRIDLNPEGASGRTCEQRRDALTGDLVLQGNQACVFGVDFAPLAMPSSGTALSETSFASTPIFGGGHTSLTFIGTPGPGLAVLTPQTGTEDFSSVPAGEVSTAHTIEIGTSPAAPVSGYLSTSITGDFFVTEDMCHGKILDPNGTGQPDFATCRIKLKFSPSSSGAKTGILTVSGSPGGTVTVTLTGTGS